MKRLFLNLLGWLRNRLQSKPPTTIINIHDVGGDVVVVQQGNVKVVERNPGDDNKNNL